MYFPFSTDTEGFPRTRSFVFALILATEEGFFAAERKLRRLGLGNLRFPVKVGFWMRKERWWELGLGIARFIFEVCGVAWRFEINGLLSKLLDEERFF